MTNTTCPHADADYCEAHDYDHVRERIETHPVFADFSPQVRAAIVDSATFNERCPQGHPYCDNVACFVSPAEFAEWDR